MYSIRNRSFICQIALLIIFLEYSFIVKSSSNREVCLKDNRRNIQYIKAQQRDATEVDWNTAWNMCSSQNLNLPVICNSKEQDAFANYLRLNIIGSAWISGKKITLQEWTWMNGQVFKGRENLEVPHESYVYVALKEDRSYKPGSDTDKNFYLCQYSGPLCNDNTYIYITMRNGCLHASDDDRTWYDARNRCLENGGDLAVLDDDGDRDTLKNSRRLNPLHSYWIGLRKIAWQWNISASVAGEVKFSNWVKVSHLTRGECIFIDASNGDWKEVGCTEKKKIVCQRTLDETKSSSTQSTTPSTTLDTTQSRTSSKTLRTTPSTVPNTTPGTMLSSTLGTTQSRTSSKTLRTTPSTTLSTTLSKTFDTTISTESNKTQTSSTLGFSETPFLLYSGVGAMIFIIIVVCIIVIILAVRSTRKSTETNNQSKAGNGSEENWPEKSPSQRANAAASAPSNAPEYGRGDIQGVYAEISLAAINKSEEKAINQEPGTVYASVEFQKEQIYQEPNKNRDTAVSPTKVDPLGDTYAIPDVKDHAVSSPGNSSGGSDSHPIKVTAQGDVYALPTKNAKSPAANSTGANLYANLV